MNPKVFINEAGAFPLEVTAITKLISYIKRVENMDLIKIGPR